MSRNRSVSDIEILKKAKVIFNKKGYAVSTQEIADNLSITQPVLFQRFENKQTLFTKSLSIASVPKWLKKLEQKPSENSFEDELTWVADHLFQFFKEHYESMTTLAASGLDKKQLPKEHVDIILELITVIKGWLHRCAESFQRPELKADVLSELLIGSIQGHFFIKNSTKKQTSASKKQILEGINAMFADVNKTTKTMIQQGGQYD